MVEVSAEEYDTIVNERVSHLEGWVTEVVIRQADGLMETTKRPIDIAPRYGLSWEGEKPGTNVHVVCVDRPKEEPNGNPDG
jgi:hypothetical protein